MLFLLALAYVLVDCGIYIPVDHQAGSFEVPFKLAIKVGRTVRFASWTFAKLFLACTTTLLYSSSFCSFYNQVCSDAASVKD
jgi:hypothetical protein